MGLKGRAVEIVEEVSKERNWSESTRKSVIDCIQGLKSEDEFVGYVEVVFDKELGRIIEDGSKQIATNAIMGFKAHDRLNKISLSLTGKKLEDNVDQIVYSHLIKVLKEPSMDELTARAMAAYVVERISSSVYDESQQSIRGELELGEYAKKQLSEKGSNLGTYILEWDWDAHENVRSDFRLPSVWFSEAIKKAIEGMPLQKFEKWFNHELSFLRYD